MSLPVISHWINNGLSLKFNIKLPPCEIPLILFHIFYQVLQTRCTRKKREMGEIFH